METDAGQIPVLGLVTAIIVLIIGWFFLFPEVCRSYPLIVPGQGFDFCMFFR